MDTSNELLFWCENCHENFSRDNMAEIEEDYYCCECYDNIQKDIVLDSLIDEERGT